jgi:biopolymer transport protein ExbD
MQVREPQGDVQVALPSAPANFSPVTDGMTLPNGAVVKTGANGTAAVLFGGVDSARLMPDSAAAVQQTVTAQSRSAEVDLTTGGVFSKVGTQVGVKGDYEVHTPFGNAVAHGTDFVTMTTSARTDVWIAQGTVELVQPDGQKVGVVTSDGAGALKIIRFPALTDPHQAMLADTETLTAILNFIPMANQKIKVLRNKKTMGVSPTADEQAYLNRIKQVPCLIKLALVEPPAPAPPPVAAPATTAAPTPPPIKLEPINLDLRPDGNVDFQGATLTLDELKPKLEEIAKATPTQPLMINGREKVAHDQLKKVIAICHAAKLKVKVAKAVPAPPTPPPVAPAAAEPPAANPPAPAVPVAPTITEPATTNPPAPAEAPAPTATPAPTSPAATPPVAQTQAAAPAPTPATTIKPLRAVVRIDGKINFQGSTYELPGFKSKLEEVMKATPDQAILIKAGKSVPYEKFQAALDICHSAPVKNLTVIAPPPTPAPAAAESPATNLPAPGLLMHPSMEPMSSNAPPAAPSVPPIPPTTNAAPPAGP